MNAIGRILILTGTLLLLTGCLESNSITGSDDVFEYDGAVFEISETIGYSSTLIAKGTVENAGSNNFYGPWYVEGDFYSDDTYSFKLGGEKFLVTFSLEPGEQTGWELRFSSNLYTESDYPGFAVKNLRAYKEDD